MGSAVGYGLELPACLSLLLLVLEDGTRRTNVIPSDVLRERLTGKVLMENKACRIFHLWVTN